MAHTFQITASLRDRGGKGAARATRRDNKVPAVIYGDKKEPVMIAIAYNEVQKILNRGGFFTHISNIDVDGTKHMAIARDIQFHPVSDKPEHIDFLRVSAKTKLTVSVPVTFLNEEKCIGLKAGGTLNVIRHTVDLLCSATSIPEHIEVDIAALEIGDSLHLSDIKLPAGAELDEEATYTLATISAPTVQTAEDEAADAAAAAPAEVPAAKQKSDKDGDA